MANKLASPYPEIAPAEPIIKPSPAIPEPKPDEDDNPWVFPQPLISPTPKARKRFSFFLFD